MVVLLGSPAAAVVVVVVVLETVVVVLALVSEPKLPVEQVEEGEVSTEEQVEVVMLREVGVAGGESGN